MLVAEPADVGEETRHTKRGRENEEMERKSRGMRKEDAVQSEMEREGETRKEAAEEKESGGSGVGEGRWLSRRWDGGVAESRGYF